MDFVRRSKEGGGRGGSEHQWAAEKEILHENILDEKNKVPPRPTAANPYGEPLPQL